MRFMDEGLTQHEERREEIHGAFQDPVETSCDMDGLKRPVP
jgi:hypothetical protein